MMVFPTVSLLILGIPVQTRIDVVKARGCVKFVAPFLSWYLMKY